MPFIPWLAQKMLSAAGFQREFFVYRGFGPKYQEWDSETAIQKGLKASGVFAACCQKRAQAIAQVPWLVKRRKRDGELEDLEGSPLGDLIASPNPDFSFSELMELASYHIDLAGNAYWLITRASENGPPLELWPLIPSRVSIVRGQRSLVDHYQYIAEDGTLRKFRNEDVIQIKTVNPNDLLYGLATIQPAGRAVDVDREAGDWQRASLLNRGVTDYAIQLDPDTTPEQQEQIRQIMKNQQSGPDNARKPFFTTHDVKVLSQTAVEMDFVASREKTWEEICSAMGVPPPMVGILANATLANIETSRKIFWMDTIVAILRMFKGQLNAQLATEYGSDIVLDYDLSNVEALRDDFNKKVEGAQKLWQMGVPFNTINEALELEVGEIPGGDVGYLSAGLLPTNIDFQALEAQTVSAELSALPTATLKRIAYGGE